MKNIVLLGSTTKKRRLKWVCPKLRVPSPLACHHAALKGLGLRMKRLSPKRKWNLKEDTSRRRQQAYVYAYIHRIYRSTYIYIYVESLASLEEEATPQTLSATPNPFPCAPYTMSCMLFCEAWSKFPNKLPNRNALVQLLSPVPTEHMGKEAIQSRLISCIAGSANGPPKATRYGEIIPQLFVWYSLAPFGFFVPFITAFTENWRKIKDKSFCSTAKKLPPCQRKFADNSVKDTKLGNGVLSRI